ncbi:ATP-binding protein [Nonomuraea sp. NBC_00507]
MESANQGKLGPRNRETRRRRFGEATFTTLDDPSELDIAKDDPRTFVRARPRPMIIDEIQRAGDPLILAIKQVVDEDWSPGQFVLPGSTRFLSIPTLSESLAGRVAFVDLWPFAVSERVGDYPEVLRLNSAVAIRAWFRGYLDTVISRDIRDFAHVNKAQAIPDLIALVAARAGGQLVLSHIADGLGLDVVTVRTYLAYLETVFLVASAPAWSNNLTSRVTHAPKTYVTDSGLAAHLMDVDAESLLMPGHPALGGLLETFVFAELLKLSTFARRHVAVRHYRDREKREVDFILERRDGSVIGIEVEASATPKSEDAKHLRWLRDKLGDRFRAGYVLPSVRRIFRRGTESSSRRCRSCGITESRRQSCRDSRPVAGKSPPGCRPSAARAKIQMSSPWPATT